MGSPSPTHRCLNWGRDLIAMSRSAACHPFFTSNSHMHMSMHRTSPSHISFPATHTLSHISNHTFPRNTCSLFSHVSHFCHSCGTTVLRAVIREDFSRIMADTLLRDMHDALAWLGACLHDLGWVCLHVVSCVYLHALPFVVHEHCWVCAWHGRRSRRNQEVARDPGPWQERSAMTDVCGTF